jgi:threonine dehydrogenase-like Zn-dependent dehydrogenase
MTEFIKRHDVKLDSIVSHTFPLEEGPKAYEIAADANSGKVVFGFD